jgi:hypothetical protein
MDKLSKEFEELNRKYCEDAKRNTEELSNINDTKKHIEKELLRLRGIVGTPDCAEQGDNSEIRHTGNSLALQDMLQSTDRLLTELLTTEEINEIKAYIDRPLYERIKWTKGDYIIVFISTVMGVAIEGLNLVWRPGSPLDRDGLINEWFDKKLHNHEKGSPIDFQVRRNDHKFDFHSHRVRSSGHDISRVYDGFRQVMNGEFRGVKWEHGKRIDVIRSTNLLGNDFPDKDWLAAFTTLSAHLFADFFSAHSLPLPLSSRVYEDCSREFSEFVHDIYDNGYNLRQFTLNNIEVFLAILTIKVWLWVKYGFGDRKRPEVRLQEYEMRSAVMGALASVNLAECAVFQNPYLLNIPVLVSSINSAVQMLRCKFDRNSAILKADRNLDDILRTYKELIDGRHP